MVGRKRQVLDKTELGKPRDELGLSMYSSYKQVCDPGGD